MKGRRESNRPMAGKQMISNCGENISVEKTAIVSPGRRRLLSWWWGCELRTPNETCLRIETTIVNRGRDSRVRIEDIR